MTDIASLPVSFVAYAAFNFTMMSNNFLVFAGIAPHPPIMVPEVGGTASSEVRGSIDAMRDFTQRIIDSRAESVVLISPHAPLQQNSFVAYMDAALRGDFSGFRAPDVIIEMPLDEELLTAITRAAAVEGYDVSGIRGFGLDHGTLVPLYFCCATDGVVPSSRSATTFIERTSLAFRCVRQASDKRFAAPDGFCRKR
jgi:aromatic ring-opening dioxygenase LigB subunit